MARGGYAVRTATSKWVQGLQFIASGDSGHAIVLDAYPEVGGTDSGPRPGELTLMALGSCTGIDVVSILKKMNVSFDSLEVKVKGEAAPEHPKVWTEVWVKYKIKGEVPEDKLQKAIELSRDRYCSVGAMFKKATKMHYDYEIVKE
jgi:putative redox protein